ncbi:MAG: hypothetical protein VB877_09870 [Pirellulaceae bacterium]
MKFSLLGLADTSRPLADAIVAHPSHQLCCIHCADPELVQQKYPGVAFDPNWESVLHNTESDIVLLSATPNPEEAEDRLRRLIQSELAVIAVQPYIDLLAAFEMAMIQFQTRSPLFCYTPVNLHPIATTIHGWIRDPLTSPIGPISQVAIQSGSENLDRDAILRSVAFDVPIVRNLVGPTTQVSAMSSAALTGPFDNLNITLKTDSSTLVTWSLDRSAAPDQRTVAIVGEKQTYTFSLSLNHSAWHPQAAVLPELDFASTDTASLFLATLPDRLALADSDESWLHWCQDLEIAETVPISLRRRRTIDILDEKRTEEGAFKGIMSMGGCGLLLATLLLLLIGSVIEGFRLPSQRLDYELQNTTLDAAAPSAPARAFWIRLWPAYPFFAFLLLQLFKLAILPPRAKATESPTTLKSPDPPGAD